MVVEFVGGSLNGQQRKIDRLYQYINTDHETYWAAAVKYEKLGWIYVWYQTDEQTHNIYQ